jgi:CubicO group peptidase (beta-lactamase class C family)
MTRRRTTRAVTVGLATVLLLLSALLTPPGTQGATTFSATVRNAPLQALLDELVATGASGAIARVDDGRHTWQLARGSARLDPHEPLRPSARFR